VCVKVLLYKIISNEVHRQLYWNMDWVNIVFTFLYAVFYNCHHPLGFLKCEEFLD
jgi:hypothetical protein